MNKMPYEEALVVIAQNYKAPILQFFSAEGVKSKTDTRIIEVFGSLAISLAAGLPINPERTRALTALLDAKDRALRARRYKEAAKLTIVPKENSILPFLQNLQPPDEKEPA